MEAFGEHAFLASSHLLLPFYPSVSLSSSPFLASLATETRAKPVWQEARSRGHRQRQQADERWLQLLSPVCCVVGQTRLLIVSPANPDFLGAREQEAGGAAAAADGRQGSEK